ncbi:MAG: ribbon-helix-helix protein, CopG family [Desulfobacterales bacterium]|nr:ribbon-helix-helix protein, CopG family [Desulfobacterales bacterium]
MIRTQVQLTEEQARLLRELSRTNRESIASLIRRAVNQFLMTRKPDRSALYRQASTIVGKYEAGAHDISVEHDRYLEEAFRS